MPAPGGIGHDDADYNSPEFKRVHQPWALPDEDEMGDSDGAEPRLAAAMTGALLRFSSSCEGTTFETFVSGSPVIFTGPAAAAVTAAPKASSAATSPAEPQPAGLPFGALGGAQLWVGVVELERAALGLAAAAATRRAARPPSGMMAQARAQPAAV